MKNLCKVIYILGLFVSLFIALYTIFGLYLFVVVYPPNEHILSIITSILIIYISIKNIYKLSKMTIILEAFLWLIILLPGTLLESVLERKNFYSEQDDIKERIKLVVDSIADLFNPDIFFYTLQDSLTRLIFIVILITFFYYFRYNCKQKKKLEI